MWQQFGKTAKLPYPWNDQRNWLANCKQALTKYPQNKYIVITNKPVNTDSFKMNANRNFKLWVTSKLV